MDMTPLLQVLPEDLSGHNERCLYRRFMGEDRERILHTPATMERELQRKYKTEMVLYRPGSMKRRRGGRRRRTAAPKPLTLDEETWVHGEVEEAMKPGGHIQWYLKTQRDEFQHAKERIWQLCECAKPKICDDTAKDQPGPSARRDKERSRLSPRS